MNSNCSPDNLVEEEEEGGVWREGYATRGSGVIAVGEEANPPVVAADGERAGLDGNSGGDALDDVVAVDLEVVVPGCIVGDNGGGTRGPQRFAAAGGGRQGEPSLSPTPLARDQPRPFCFAAAGRTRGFSEASGVGNWGFWEPGEGKVMGWVQGGTETVRYSDGVECVLFFSFFLYFPFSLHSDINSFFLVNSFCFI
jgi:hypothetical protein